MFWRALMAFLALPGIVAILVPALLADGARSAGARFHAVGVIPLLVGLVLLLWCVRDFSVAGRGTLAPWAPPRNLVTIGLYRHSRNPMYLAVTLMLIGWALCFVSRTLAIYTGFVMVGFHLRVVLGEEPWLEQTHGDAWREYKSRVRRWL